MPSPPRPALPPQDLTEARRVLKLTSFLDGSPGHRHLLWNHLATSTIDKAQDHAVDCVVAHRRGKLLADAWQDFQFPDHDLWQAIVDLSGSREDVTNFGLGLIAAWLKTLEVSSRLAIAEAVQMVYLERLVRVGVEKSLPQVPERTINERFPAHFIPGQFLAAKRSGIRALLRCTRPVKLARVIREAELPATR